MQCSTNFHLPLVASTCRVCGLPSLALTQHAIAANCNIDEFHSVPAKQSSFGCRVERMFSVSLSLRLACLSVPITLGCTMMSLISSQPSRAALAAVLN